ncbi:uncharacterized protein TNCV_3502741 [Trichonephila clavipes]|uniref:Uncharacterized protein n=1 Tax=Trichonephila clavipes TaxID=2585209 RepID=A0A8X6VC18_TRICX|nr:uncharacterized protein TNCV_3502741 [Trichonephila clavipes]
MSVTKPNISPINLKFTENYNLLLQEISRKYPTSKSKLSGKFFKIFAASIDDHRAITTLLTEKGEQYFALNPVLNKPQKVVIKGLPINTDIEEIRQDLTSRGFKVIKVAQFNKSKSKMKPHFYGGNRKIPGFPDIFKLRLVATSQSKLIHITADQEQCSAITATSFTIPQQTATLKPAALSAAKLIERATAP